MGVSADVFKQAQDQLKDWSPGGAAPPSEQPGVQPQQAQSGWSVGQSLAQSGKEIGSALATGFSTGADFLKGAAAGALMPLIPEGDTPGARAAWAVLRPSTDVLSESTKKAAESPETVLGKVLNPAASGAGAMVTMPMGGGVVRNIVAGMGMGEGAEIGKHVLGGIFAYFDPSARKAGEATGSILGGAGGAQLNISRVAALGAAFKHPADMIGNIVPAYKSARAAQQAGDSRRLWEIFADEFGNLRATTRGIIAEYTNAELASALQRDPYSMANAKQFAEDAALTGLKTEVPMPGGVVKPWGLSQQTANPTLAQIEMKRAPKNLEEGVNVNQRVQARQQSIIDAYNKLAGPKPPATEDGAIAAGEVFKKITQAKMDALTAEQTRLRDKFPDLNAQTEFALGEQARAQRDALAKQSYAVASAKYGNAERLWDAPIDVSGVRDKLRPMFEDFIASVNPAEVPPIVKQFMAATVPSEIPVSIGLKDANDVLKAINRLATDYKQTERFQEFNRALTMRNAVTDAINASPASTEAKAAFADAQKYWATEHAPRFMEGLGKALGKERGGVFEGREAVESQKVMDRALSDETAMRDWEAVFSKDSTAKTVMRGALEGKYREVLNRAKTPEALEAAQYEFAKKYSSGLTRFPEVADKIDQHSATTVALMTEQQRELVRYRDIVGSPVTQSIGPVQAKKMYEQVLADPLKMDALLRAVPGNKGDAAKKMVKEVWLQANPMKDGVYDPESIMKLLTAGSNNPAVKSSMGMLFETAFGKEGGQKHWDTLNAIAGFQAREAMTNPGIVKPGEMISASPILQATGQRAASWISAGRVVGAGQAGGTYFTILGLSRFANAKAQAAVESAKLKALYDPDTAKAVLEMAATPSTQPLGLSTARKIFGNLSLPNGQSLVDRLIDRGYVKQYVVRGAVYGAEQALQP